MPKRAWRFLKWPFAVFIWGLIVMGALVVYFLATMPNLEKLSYFHRAPSVIFLASNNREIATRGDVFGKAVTLKTVPAFLIKAIIASEDRRFFEHKGINWKGIVRATLVNITRGKVTQGGSTITQQLAKNIFLSHERSFSRKFKELFLTFWLESLYSKEQILNIYLNRVYLGSGTFGFDAAAQKYFGKHAEHINLGESALLVGLLKAPSKYSRTQKRFIKRGLHIISLLKKNGYISQKDYDVAYTQIHQAPFLKKAYTHTEHFVQWVAAELPYLVDIDQDLIVRTTLSLPLQNIAYKTLKESVTTWGKSHNIGNGAYLAMDTSGAIRALIGGQNYNHTQFNLVTQAQRQAGSVFKLFVYLAALENGISPKDTVSDAPFITPSWNPKNQNWQEKGDISIEESFTYSVNTAAIRVAHLAGLKSIESIARCMGINTPIHHNLSVALGTNTVSLFELVKAYAVVPNEGKAVTPFAIQEIRTKSGDVLYTHPKTVASQRCFSKNTADIMDVLLANVIAKGTGRLAQLSFIKARGKTGTTQLSRDAWFIGYTDTIVSGVWLGNSDNSPMRRIYGGTLPARIWKAIMTNLATSSYS